MVLHQMVFSKMYDESLLVFPFQRCCEVQFDSRKKDFKQAQTHKQNKEVKD